MCQICWVSGGRKVGWMRGRGSKERVVMGWACFVWKCGDEGMSSRMDGQVGGWVDEWVGLK